jgi:hypothetical protein
LAAEIDEFLQRNEWLCEMITLNEQSDDKKDNIHSVARILRTLHTYRTGKDHLLQWYSHLEARRLALATVDDIRHVGGQHKWHAVALDAAKLLCIAEKLAIVDVEEEAALCKHHIIIVTIANACKHVIIDQNTLKGDRPMMYVATQ